MYVCIHVYIYMYGIYIYTHTHIIYVYFYWTHVWGDFAWFMTQEKATQVACCKMSSWLVGRLLVCSKHSDCSDIINPLHPCPLTSIATGSWNMLDVSSSFVHLCPLGSCFTFFSLGFNVVRVQGFVWGEHVVSVREGCILSLDDFPPGTWCADIWLAKAPAKRLGNSEKQNRQRSSEGLKSLRALVCHAIVAICSLEFSNLAAGEANQVEVLRCLISVPRCFLKDPLAVFGGGVSVSFQGQCIWCPRQLSIRHVIDDVTLHIEARNIEISRNSRIVFAELSLDMWTQNKATEHHVKEIKGIPQECLQKLPKRMLRWI